MRKETLVTRFANHVVAQIHEIFNGTAKKGNRHANAYMRIFKQLCQQYGDAGRDELARLFSDPRPEVRVAAAGYLLRHRHQEAMKVLLELARGAGLVAFEAQQVMKRWEEGEWKLDLVDPNRLTSNTGMEAKQ